MAVPAQVRLFLCLQDNYGVLVHDPSSGATAAIDAPEAGPVETALKGNGWKLTDILVTHHHGDHTGGIAALKQQYGCRVVAPRGEAAKIPQVDETVGEGDTVKVGNLTAKVLETPGHTLGHIAYWFDADKLAFVGDTLFSIGCGRVIEGNPEMMWRSLAKLRELPGRHANFLRARIYAGEYPLRAHDRAGEQGAGPARAGSRQACLGEKADPSYDHGGGTRGQCFPARRCAGSGGGGRHERQAAGGGLCGNAHAQEQVLARTHDAFRRRRDQAARASAASRGRAFS